MYTPPWGIESARPLMNYVVRGNVMLECFTPFQFAKTLARLSTCLVHEALMSLFKYVIRYVAI
jgi:hypothetical protein